MKKKCMIFGCGEIGTQAYCKLKNNYDIAAYIDNNQALWGSVKDGVAVISPKEIEIVKDGKDCEIILALSAYQEVMNQLSQLNIDEVMVWEKGLLYKYNVKRCLFKSGLHNDEYYIKKDKDKMSILYVQATVCIRTLKIARAASDLGAEVSLAYCYPSRDVENKNYTSIFLQVYPIYSFESLMDYVNNSEFDVVHCSNEPDYLTILLQKSNKPVIHDCHDLTSAYKGMETVEIITEFVANKNSKGVVYTTNGIREVAIRKFGLERKYTHVLENLISQELAPTEEYEKMSCKDGELHCVYEGGVLSGDKSSHRYLEELWIKIARTGVHVHFYTNCEIDYCSYLESLNPLIHYEGNFSSKELSVEMSKYDVGLCILNITEKNKQYLEFASPNKIQEYVNAGIPVAVGNIKSQIEFVESNGFGGHLDLEDNIREQLETISKIKIKKGILWEKGYTLESKIDELIAFYKRCIESNSKKSEY